MILSGELMKGNYFEYEGRIAEVVTILQDEKSDFKFIGDTVTFLRKYKDDDCPKKIKITKKWLDDLNFEKRGSAWFIELEEKDCMLFVEDDFSVGLCDDIGNYIIPPVLIEYIHELQNFYYVHKHEKLKLN